MTQILWIKLTYQFYTVVARAAISLINIAWVIQAILKLIFYATLPILHYITSTQYRMHQIICVRLELCNRSRPRNKPKKYIIHVVMLQCLKVYLYLSNKLQWHSPYCYLSRLLHGSMMVVLTQHLSRKCQSPRPLSTNSLYIFNLKELMITDPTNDVKHLLQ